MDARLRNASTLLGLALSVANLTAAQAVRTGYLAKTGPAPLRFRPDIAQNSTISLPLPAVSQTPDSGKPTNPPARLAADESKPGAADPEPASPVSEPIDGVLTGESLLPKPAGQTPTAPTANDLLVVTPQMLIDYFKPTGGSTNGAGTSVLIPVTFTPATPSTTPSSRATYRTE